MLQQHSVPSIPTPENPADRYAQREAVALFQRFRELLDDPEPLSPVLRRIAAHGCARRLLAAHGYDVDRILRSCEDHIASWGVREPEWAPHRPSGPRRGGAGPTKAKGSSLFDPGRPEGAPGRKPGRSSPRHLQDAGGAA